MAKEPINETNWTEVAAKAQAYQAMHLAGLNDKKMTVTEKAKFLMILGLSRPDAAGLLRSSDDSLRHLLATDAKKGAGTRSPKEPDGE